MRTFRLTTSIKKIFVCLPVLLTVIQHPCNLWAAIAPERDVIIIDNQGKTENPSWKNIWDEARKLARNGELAGAAIKYHALLSIKPNIEEAKWEYCKVLVELKKWADASIILESLLEIDPNRTEYLLKAGNVALNNKQYQQAVKYFAQIYQKDPFAPAAVEALEGLTEGLIALGKKQEAYPLLQQLHLRKPNDAGTLLQLARLAKDFGLLEKAASYYSTLIARFKVDDHVLLEAAFVYEQQGKEDRALLYQLKYLERHRYYLPLQQKVADFYLKTGKKRLALPHLLILEEHGQSNGELQLLIGRIYLSNENRPDKALLFFEKYRKNHPGDRSIEEEIKKTQTVLANDLLSIVLNDGAAMLWRDLAKITPNRQAIYETMADLLEKMGKDKEQFEVLKIVHEQNPKDKKIIWRLAELSFKNERYKSAFNYLKLLDGAANEFPRYLSLRAQVEEILGYDQAALKTYSEYLKQNPDNLKVRTTCLRLAGNLGMMETMRKLYREIPKQNNEKQKIVELQRVYLDGLLENKMYADVEAIYSALLGRFSKENKLVANLRLRLAENYFKDGQVFLAEQMAREVLAEKVEIPEALGKLSNMAFQDGNLDWGKAWLYLMAKNTGVDLLANNYAHWPTEVFYQKVELFVAEQKYETAISMLGEYLRQLEKNKLSDGDALTSRAELLLCRLLYKSKQYERAKNRIHEILKKHPDEVEAIVLLEKILKTQPSGPSTEKQNQGREAQKIQTPFTHFKAAKYEYEYGEYKKAALSVDTYLNEVPSSVGARILKAKIRIAQKRYGQALKIFNSLSKEFPAQGYFHNQVLELEFKQGNFKKIIEQISPGSQIVSHKYRQNSESGLDNTLFEQRLLLARSLWAEGQLDAASKVYQSLLKPPVEKEFLKKLESTGTDFRLSQLKRSFWERLTSSSKQDDDPMATVMEPLFIGDHLGSPINTVSADLYGTYRWQRLVQNELSAKQAVMHKDYHQAEKEYKALVKTSDSDESLYDLAKVYSRLELYGKEGELYERLKEKGTEYPKLENLAQQNALKRQPRVSFDYSFLNEKGRDGYIDIKKKTGGIEGWRMPAFNQEVDVRAERNYYTSNNSGKEIWTTKLNGTYTINLRDDADISMGLGGDFANADADNFLYMLQLKGRIDNYISGNISLRQDTVDDTIQAIRQGIYHKDFETGLKIDYFPRLFFGGDYRYRQYTDSNYQNWYHLWTSYDLFGEMSLLQLKYEYSTLQNTRANLGRNDDFLSDFSSGDLPYWSPGVYWQHLLTIRFKHDIETDSAARSGNSYYAFDYSFGYETGSELIDSLGFNIFIEMSRHFLLKGNFKYYEAGDYTMHAGMLSVIYRW